ncbi:MAG: twin-arginine translocation signal domain-containing protein [Planctomycetaceae bacterium]
MPVDFSSIASRRDFLKHSSLAAAAGMMLPNLAHGQTESTEKSDKPFRVAAICTVMFYRSHAHVILENFLQDYIFNGKRTSPGMEVVALYFDQRQPNDIVDAVLEKFPIPVYKTAGEALCQGGDKLAVDAVLNIGEHGNYAENHIGQYMYPRKRLFDEAVAVMKRSNKFVPLFNDKYLAFNWEDAKEMYDTSKKYGFSLMAGSSVPLAERRPPLELEPGLEITEAVSIHPGGVESYDFHGLEVLQAMIESRKGGETGVSKVEFLEADALMQAAEEGRWDYNLALDAMEADLGYRPKKGELALRYGILVHYKDGLKATVISVPEIEWGFACRIKGEPEAQKTSFHVGPWQNRNLFKALSHAIQYSFKHNESPYPVERTLLTTGILDALMHSRHYKKPWDTPHLEFSYQAKDYKAMREMGESWKILTEDIPEPPLISPIEF